MGTPAEVLSKLTKNEPVACDVFAPEGEHHFLHKIPWIEQMLLDATVHDFVELAKARNLGDVATRILLVQVSAIGVVQASLRKGQEPTSPLVFPSLSTAVEALRGLPAKVAEVDNLYASSFEITNEEKKI